MRKVVKKVDQMLIAARGKVLQKKPAVDHHYVHHYCCGSWYCGTFVHFRY